MVCFVGIDRKLFSEMKTYDYQVFNIGSSGFQLKCSIFFAGPFPHLKKKKKFSYYSKSLT